MTTAMTRDEILAEIDTETIRLNNATADVALYTTQRDAAIEALTFAADRRDAAQARLAHLADLLATLPTPTEWDPTAITHAWPDAWGCRNTVPADVFQARTGRPKRCHATYVNEQPFNRPDAWPAHRPEVANGDARLLIGVTPKIHADLRGQHDQTPATLARWESQCLAEMKAWGDGRRDARIERAAQSNIDTYGDAVDRNIYRIGWEFDGRWFPWSICPTDDHARAWRAMVERIVDIFCTVADRPLTFAFNLAGTPQCSEDRIDLALALDLHPHAVGMITLDDYIAALGDLTQLRSNLARLRRHAIRHQWCRAVGFDEIGPHNGTKDSAALLNQLEPIKAEWITTLAIEAKLYADGKITDGAGRVIGLSHILPFETIYPNGRALSCVLIGDRTQRIQGTERSLILAGRQTSTYRAHNGDLIPSNDPAMATALIAAMHMG